MGNNGEGLKGFALSGEMIKNMKDKHFQIIDVPKYVTRPDLDDPKKEVEKVIMTVKLADGTTEEYMPNKTSQVTIRNKVGSRVFKKWKGFKGKFITREQSVRKVLKDVIYVKE